MSGRPVEAIAKQACSIIHGVEGCLGGYGGDGPCPDCAEIVSAIREAVAQERAALREAIDNESCEFWEGDHYGKRYKSGQPYDYEREHCTRCCLLARLDAREKSE